MFPLKLLLITTALATFICLTMIILPRQWESYNILQPQPSEVINIFMESGTQLQNDLQQLPTSEYDRRVQRVRDVCKLKEYAAMAPSRIAASNRQFGMNIYCTSHRCPIFTDGQSGLFFCFIPKVASTFIKRYFLDIFNIPGGDDLVTNRLHNFANNQMMRISPAYYTPAIAKHFFKIMFVRHPFERVVSAFRDKSERISKNNLFYKTYFDPIMKKLRPENATIDTITFVEFVWYLINTPVSELNDHWAPFWSRCDPCLVDYDFIGKLEYGQDEFPYAFRKAGFNSNSDWFEDLESTSGKLALNYFSVLSDEDILKLYQLYKQDFDLFGYTIDEYLPSSIRLLYIQNISTSNISSGTL